LSPAKVILKSVESEKDQISLRKKFVLLSRIFRQSLKERLPICLFWKFLEKCFQQNFDRLLSNFLVRIDFVHCLLFLSSDHSGLGIHPSKFTSFMLTNNYSDLAV
jgi:hypothetical protein